MNVESLEKVFGAEAEVREYGRGFVVQTIFCSPQTAEPLVVGIIENEENKLDLTDFGFASEFLEKNKLDLDELFYKISDIAKQHDVEWIDDEICCSCDTKEVKTCWSNMVEAMQEILSLSTK